MNKRFLLLMIILLLLIALTVFFMISNRGTRFSWSPNFKAANKDPYGTFVLSELLKNYFPGEGFKVLSDSIKGNLPTKPSDPSSYVFVGQELYLDSTDTQVLLSFVANGNTAFISSEAIPYDLMFYIYDECEEDYYWDGYSSIEDTAIQVNLSNPALSTSKDFTFNYLYRNKIKEYYWNYIDSSYFCGHDSSLIALGKMNDTLFNFAFIRYGKGVFYLHTIPLAFSNIQLLDKEKLQYADKVFSYLPEGKIYWDEYSKTAGALPPTDFRRNRALSKESPLQYVLSQPPLAWAWYVLVGIGLLYLLFRTKRRQRIIPVIEANNNTSLEFLSTIARLYFLQNDHKKLALHKMRLFQSFIRERYHLQGREMDEELIEKLTIKSDVSRELISKIMLMYNNIKNSNMMTENTLIQFHQLLDDFYKNCK